MIAGDSIEVQSSSAFYYFSICSVSMASYYWEMFKLYWTPASFLQLPTAEAARTVSNENKTKMEEEKAKEAEDKCLKNIFEAMVRGRCRTYSCQTDLFTKEFKQSLFSKGFYLIHEYDDYDDESTHGVGWADPRPKEFENTWGSRKIEDK